MGYIENFLNLLNEIKKNSGNSNVSFSSILKKYGFTSLPLHHVLVKNKYIYISGKRRFIYTWLAQTELTPIIAKNLYEESYKLKRGMKILRKYKKNSTAKTKLIDTYELYKCVDQAVKGINPFFKEEQIEPEETQNDLEKYSDEQLWNELKSRGWSGNICKTME